MADSKYQWRASLGLTKFTDQLASFAPAEGDHIEIGRKMYKAQTVWFDPPPVYPDNIQVVNIELEEGD